MFFGKKLFLFALGGAGYVGLELLWRRRSHGSMFFAGGTCFLLLGQLAHRCARLPLLLRGLLGSAVITAVELVTGLAVNADHRIWDYGNVPLNLWGQICLPFCGAWVPVSLAAMKIYRLLDRKKVKL